MNRALLIAARVVALIVLVVIFSPFYTIDPTQQVIVFQFGAPQGVETEPGLHLKMPWVQTVTYIEKRLLALEAPPEEVIAQDKKRLVVDSFARWRIVDPLKFYQKLGDQDTALLRLTPILSSNVRRVLGAQNFSAVLSGEREQLMRDVRDNMNEETAELGIRIVDVRIRHADLPPQNSDAIYNRMKQERLREANEFRAEGSEISQRIRARAEREATILLAEATRESEILHGEGDAEKTRILADAYGQDPDFFAFYRSMRAYQEALPSANTSAVLSPDSEFFRYFQQAGGAAAGSRRKR
jgi:membrane protease subunit HflC